MTGSGHGQEHSELLALYAAQALPASEARVAESQLATCPECRHELQSLRPVIDSLVAWPTDVLRPPRPLWERIEQRIAGETTVEPPSTVPARSAEPEWSDVGPGIACQLLSTDVARDRVSMLVRLAPGAEYPPHRHRAVEELYMLYGELIVDDKTFYPGDYRRAEPNTVDQRVWSESGCTCVLVTSIHDALL